ncbi:collectin-10 [Plakobranchus ocellatus]|uniref:Collectin-10 n=1 Tax=Plakobranchus ocellatus TaxID=259542 RepID=A0AAV3ZU56_9GAST|nr:collectin-10 [Plakobranchus ocellatus]
MSLRFNWLFLGVVLIIAISSARGAPFRPFLLKAIKPKYVNSDSPSLELQCTFDRQRTNLVSVNQLEMYRLDIGRKEKSEMMAKIEGADLVYGFDQSNISASGQISNDTKSTLAVSYTSNTDGYCQVYVCVAKGLKENGEEESISRSRTVKGMNNTHCEKPSRPKVRGKGFNERIQECCVSSETVQAQATAIESLEEEMEECSALNPEVRNSFREIEELREEITKLSAESNGMENNATIFAFDEFDDRLKILTERVDSLESLTNGLRVMARGYKKIFSIDTNKYTVSSMYSNSVYAVHMSEENYDLPMINNLCYGLGGRVAEIDDKYEQMFVGDFVKRLGNYGYYIGANDVKSEGSFVQFDSNNPVPDLKWEQGQPKSPGTNEDCVQITESGLVNVECGQLSRFVCEVRVFVYNYQ